LKLFANDLKLKRLEVINLDYFLSIIIITFEMRDMKTTKRNRLYSCISLALTLSISAVPVFAQDDENVEELSRIEVTGSKIRQVQIEGIEPTQTISREDIDRSGLTSVGDILQQLTQSGSAINTRFNSSGNFGFPPNGGGIGAGATQVDMRHLGSSRVLVLVDGLRWIAGSSASGVSNAVDMNTIPVGIIERIDILKDGASSIYGADAIAGVINIITKSNVDGGEVRGYIGGFDEGDGETTQLDFTFGQTSDKMSVVFNVGYSDQQEVSAADRSLAQFPVPFTGVTQGSSGTPQGRFLFLTPDGIEVDCTINNGVSGIPGFNPLAPCAGDDFHAWSNNDRFNFAPFNYVVTPSERYNVFGQVNVELTDSVSWFVKALYNNRTSVNQAAPEPIFIGPFAEAGAIADNIIISATNPYNPFGYDLFDDGFGFIGRRPLEAGPRIFKQDVDTFYFSSGLDGSFNAANRSWFWDVSAVYAKNQASQTKTGALNIARIASALGPLADCEATPGCVPLNIFGGQGANGEGTITPEMLEYISFVQHDSSEQELTDFTANLSGDLFELPAGPLSVAVGYEYRKKQGFFQPDAIVVAGESNGVPASPTSGEFSVDEFYAEFLVPVLSEVQGAHLLDFSLAFRSSDYSTSGSDTTSKFGFKYMPTEDLMFRGSYADGLRAPSIGELFGSQSRFDATLTDPCEADDVTGAIPSLPGCSGIPNGYHPINTQTSVLTGGNPTLSPEEANTLTLGLVYSPAWAEGTSWSERLDFEVTYYDIEIDGAIQAVDAQFILDTCAQNPSEVICSSFGRDNFGNIENFNNTLTNIGGIETSGVDFNITWTSPQYDWGFLEAAWTNSFVNEFTEYNPATITAENPTGFEPRDLDGIEVNNSAIPDWNSNLYTTANIHDWKVTWGMRYINGVTETCDFTDFGICSDNVNGLNSLGGTTYHDLQVIFPKWNEVEFELGINNITDKTPPTCFSCSLNGYDPSTYDAQGVFGYLRATYKF
jgi:iron complex outermembrane receptor protein